MKKNKSSSTVKAAKAQIQRDTKNKANPTPTRAQESLVDRHIRTHTPDSLYGENAEG